MKKSLIKLINKILYPFNINVQKAYNKSFEFPVEATQRDIEIIEKVLKPNGNFNERYTKINEKRLYAAISSIKYVEKNNIEGDIVECGVWKGGCALAMALTLKDLNSSRKIRLYDTFTGMTEPTDIDINKNNIKAIKWYEKSKNIDFNDWNYAPLHLVKKLFDSFGVSNNALFIKGDVMETLDKNQNLPKKIAVLRLDTDFYESTKKELEILYPRIELGGIMLLDDYGHWLGSKQAVDEYFEKNLDSYPLMWVNDFSSRGLVKVK